MKINMGEVKGNQESLNASIKVMKSQLQSAQASLAKLANNKESLEGTVRTAIDAKIKYHQLPLLMNYEGALDIMSKDYDAFIATFQSEVGESDSNAIINTDYLSELSAIFPGITQALSYIQRDTSSTYSDIADIISLTDPSTSEITTALTEAKQILTDTTNKMSSFNELGTPGTFSEMMGQQNSELATLSSIQGPNYTAPNILSVYQNSDFGLKVKDNMSKDPAQYKVQLQNELAKELVDNYYSKLPPEAPLQPYEMDAKTKALIDRANTGDPKAIDELIKRYDYHKALNSARHYSQAEINRSNAIFWEKSRQGLIHMAGEFTNYYNLIRLTRGIDPVTGEPANRFEAGVLLGVDAAFGIAKLNKLAKAANVVDKVSDTARATNKIVWDKITPTQPELSGTSIPKSFNIKVGDRELWVAPNGTKHMYEFVERKGLSNTSLDRLNGQLILSEFSSALDVAIAENGLVTERMIYGGDWEFILSEPRNPGQNIVVKHARFNPNHP